MMNTCGQNINSIFIKKPSTKRENYNTIKDKTGPTSA